MDFGIKSRCWEENFVEFRLGYMIFFRDRTGRTEGKIKRSARLKNLIVATAEISKSRHD